ncbi:hypothetical protein Q8A67_006435 [Cirrhinus molitorella]|uniref:Uncharacterized protein n=1 Tax=Cirrhinus molitorella TaxID=172907 RepID=A0AA88Q956_9TELE|nr:hypothetical protein Q8A67_006435 [Cirrhinus molitorella]
MDDTLTSTDEDVSPRCSSVQQKRSEPESSCVSVRSDWSMDHPIEFKSGDTKTDLRKDSREQSGKCWMRRGEQDQQRTLRRKLNSGHHEHRILTVNWRNWSC